MAVSANTLFHFTGCLDNLVNILNSGGFWPRYCVEYGWRKKFAVCQCCFCDIPLSDIQKHTKNYGCYGLGMSKEWGMSNGISAQVRKSVDGPPDMLTEDHHHTVHEERQVCYSSHLRPKSLHL